MPKDRWGMRPVTPEVTVDAIIELPGGRVVLVERRFFPEGWALPGGFVDPGESLARAVRREALEETSLDVEVLSLFHVYSRPWRDPRGDTVTAVYHCRAAGEPLGADDAKQARAFGPGEIPYGSMAFDHAGILRQFFEWRATGAKPSVEE
ncbi:MAG TPA: NUDIX hydrolase [Candidatus Fermentibacter sp.]|nr:NUDIX hydrolase [Candidatus Fermentibacter sp.]